MQFFYKNLPDFFFVMGGTTTTTDAACRLIYVEVHVHSEVLANQHVNQNQMTVVDSRIVFFCNSTHSSFAYFFNKYPYPSDYTHSSTFTFHMVIRVHKANMCQEKSNFLTLAAVIANSKRIYAKRSSHRVPSFRRYNNNNGDKTENCTLHIE